MGDIQRQTSSVIHKYAQGLLLGFFNYPKGLLMSIKNLFAKYRSLYKPVQSVLACRLYTSTSFDKVYDCRKSEHWKTNWHDPKIEKGSPSDLQIRKATVLGKVTIAWNLYKGRVQVIAPILLLICKTMCSNVMWGFKS